MLALLRVPGGGIKQQRDHAAMLLMYGLGLRLAEVATLRDVDVDLVVHEHAEPGAHDVHARDARTVHVPLDRDVDLDGARRRPHLSPVRHQIVAGLLDIGNQNAEAARRPRPEKHGQDHLLGEVDGRHRLARGMLLPQRLELGRGACHRLLWRVDAAHVAAMDRGDRDGCAWRRGGRR